LVHAPPHPERLLAVVLSIERELGRERRERWGPRVIDLDILWGDGVHVESNTLCVPHPALRERAFALLPLLELVPDASDPATGERYSVASARAGTAGILAVRPWVLGS
jgi:2-amino-4-hydroxy-6-hydroxymethyldihydropteridine diphosphokinase